MDPARLAEAIVQRAEGHFHDEQLPLGRALDPLPFTPTDALEALVRDCCPPAAAASARVRPANPYALQPDTLDFLDALLERTTPKLMIEFGSGESTRLFAQWAAAHDARLISVEHDRSWVAEVAQQLTPAQRDAVKLLHAPLRPRRRGLRQFLTYRGLDGLVADVTGADLFLLDGPHISGRELVLYLVLSHCRPGATIVIDDFRHLAVREMLIGVPGPLARCFAGVAVRENSHGLFVMQCLKDPPATRIPNLDARSILRSYWRCLRDLRAYGTGD